MPFSAYLDGKRKDCADLVAALSPFFSYVSVLGTDVRSTAYTVTRSSSSIRDGEGECGFVVKLHDGGAFYEYSLDDISGDKQALAKKIIDAVRDFVFL